MSSNYDFQIHGNIPVNSTLQDIEDQEENDSFNFEEEKFSRRGASSVVSRNSRNSINRRLTSCTKQENFDSRPNEYYENDNEIGEIDNNEIDDCYYDNEEITSITRINQSNKMVLKSFRDKFPTTVRIPTEPILSSSSSFNSLTDNQEYDNQPYDDVEEGYIEDEYDESNERKLSSARASSRRWSKSKTELSKSDLNRIYKELNEIHNRLVVSFFLIKKYCHFNETYKFSKIN